MRLKTRKNVEIKDKKNNGVKYNEKKKKFV